MHSWLYWTDDNFEVSGVLDEMMQKINQLNKSLSQEKEKVKKLEFELTEKVNQLNETLNQDKAIVTKLKGLYVQILSDWFQANPCQRVAFIRKNIQFSTGQYFEKSL